VKDEIIGSLGNGEDKYVMTTYPPEPGLLDTADATIPAPVLLLPALPPPAEMPAASQ
jgi:hypothetical protein